MPGSFSSSVGYTRGEHIEIIDMPSSLWCDQVIASLVADDSVTGVWYELPFERRVPIKGEKPWQALQSTPTK